jgi:SAM-dependent methyltransferase
MKDSKDLFGQYYDKDIAARKNWYSPAARDYEQVRPHYPQKVISRVIELAQISPGADILEIGCGPGTATISFAELGFSMLCIEPNPDFYRLVQKNCNNYAQVEIINTFWEEWEPKEKRFDAVLAATSIHWIDPEIAYPKIAKVLRDRGSLILLWNVPAISSIELHQVLQPVYELYAPSLGKYKSIESHQDDFRAIGQLALDLGKFQDLVFEWIVSEVSYSIDKYLKLLSTFSPYIELDELTRKSLFTALKKAIQDNFGERISFSYMCAFHVARKLDSDR